MNFALDLKFVFLEIMLLFPAYIDGYYKNRTLYELMMDDNRFNKVSMMINDAGLSPFFEQNHITAFIPTTEALLTFDDRKYGYDLMDRDTVKSLLLYHIVAGTFLNSELPSQKEATSLHPSGFKVFFNHYSNGHNTVYTVNGACIITSNITASNGVLHIIDRVLAPVTSPQTLHDYILHPQIPNYSFSSINNASIVDLDLKASTNDPKKMFTLFLPDDSHLVNIPEYGQNKLFTDWFLIRKVYHAHTVKDTVSFIPSKGDIPSLTSMEGDITFYRENNQVYVKNNRVKAMVLHSNIPTINGVIHIIDNLLYFVYMNIIQTLEKLPNTQTFKIFLDRSANGMKSRLQNADKMTTVFVPTDTAFAKIPSNKQNQFNSDLAFLEEILSNHVVDGELGIEDLHNGLVLTTLTNKTFTVLKDSNGIYLETEDIRVTIVETDIGCTNGVVHLIDNVIMKNDYTIWKAIEGNITQLGKMKNIIKNFSDLSTLLNNAALHITIFLPMDYVMEDIPGCIVTDFENNPDILYNAISGHIILGHVITMLNVTDNEVFTTYGGHELTTSKQGNDITVTGSYISARVKISDIICSNGIIHVIDNLMHIPTRNVLDEMKRHSEISVISSFVGLFTMTKLQSLLSDERKDVTMFVPTNKAFYDIPKSRANKLLMDSLLLERILQAHIVSTGTHLIEQLYPHQNLISEENTIYVQKMNNTVGLVSNNVHSKITRSNIRATNGVIHMVDRVLYYPYFTVAETMSNDPRLIPFFDMMFKDEEFKQISESSENDVTVFVPPADSLDNIPANPSVLTKLFLGHILPNERLDQKYLRTHNNENPVERSSNNVTFSLTNQTIGYSIDVGYSNLRYYFNTVTEGIACSNGIIYIIGGLLNYNDRTLLEEINQDTRLLHSLNFMMKLWPPETDSTLWFNGATVTMFLPQGSVIDGLSHIALDYLDNITVTQKHELFLKHIYQGHSLTVNEMSKLSDLQNGIQVVNIDDDMYLQWNNTIAKIVQSNILASNGIIHIIDKLFIDLPEEPTTRAPEVTTKKKSSQTNTGVVHFKMNSLILTILTLCLLF